jgi:hypothetical protein
MAVNNAIGWVQFKLIGGARNLAVTAGAYAAAAIVLMIFATQISYRPSFAELGYYIPLISGIQMVILLLWGTMRVGHAVRLDVNTGILESHRLMPVSPIAAILGYVFGSTAQVLSLFAVNVVLGAVCVAAGSLPIRLWVLASAVLLCYAVMVWTIVIFFSFRFGGAAICVVGIQIIMNILRAEPLQVFPGLQLIAMPMADRSFFNLSRFDGLEALLTIGCVLQVLITGTYLIAAGRRYARDNVLAFDWPLSALLLALWIGATLVGVTMLMDQFRTGQPFYGQVRSPTVIASSLTAIVLLAILPISGAIRSHRLPPVAAVLGTSALVCLTLCVAPRASDHAKTRYLICALDICAFLASIRYVLGLAVERRWWTRRSVHGSSRCGFCRQCSTR